MAGEICDYPLDTIKTQLQRGAVGNRRGAAAVQPGMWRCLSNMFAKEGPRGFFRGVTAPMLGCIGEFALQFSVFGQCQVFLENFFGPSEVVPLHCAFLCGAPSGFFVAHVLTPAELIKCKLQLNRKKYSGTLDCLRKTYRKGGMRGLYCGHTATLARDVPGNMAWFGTYEGMTRLFAGPSRKKSDLSSWEIAFCGSCAGVAYWSAFYPADVVKTRIQGSISKKKLTLWTGLKSIYKNEGLAALYRGWSIAAIRAGPTSAVVFTTYEKISRFVKGE